MDEDEAVARAQRAWDEGRPEEAARILEAWIAAHPERAEALRGKGFAGPGVSVPPPEVLREVPCLRCAGPAAYRGRLRLHAGSNLAPFVLGDLGELLVDIAEHDAYACPECGHVELFLPGKARAAGP